MADWSKVGKKSKSKGSAFERKVAEMLTKYTGVNFRKTPSSGGWNKQGVEVAGRVFCGDVICDQADFRFSVEAKNRKAFDILHLVRNPETDPFTEWWFQTTRDAKSNDLLPIMFIRPRAGSPHLLVALAESDLKALGIVTTGFKITRYDNTINFHVREKAPGDKRMDKHEVKARLPIPMLIHWETFKTDVDPNILFGDIDFAPDYGDIYNYD